MSQIKLQRLQRIIREEIARMNEGADHDSASKLMSSATKLLGAIEAFEESATEKSKSEMSENLAALKQTLQRVITSPMQYVDSTEPGAVQKKVSLKPVKGSETL